MYLSISMYPSVLCMPSGKKTCSIPQTTNLKSSLSFWGGELKNNVKDQITLSVLCHKKTYFSNHGSIMEHAKNWSLVMCSHLIRCPRNISNCRPSSCAAWTLGMLWHSRPPMRPIHQNWNPASAYQICRGFNFVVKLMQDHAKSCKTCASNRRKQ